MSVNMLSIKNDEKHVVSIGSVAGSDVSISTNGSATSDIALKALDSNNSFSKEKPSLLIIFLTVLTSISGFMFGYDTGYISSALVSIGDSFGEKLSYGDEQLITAATSLGALIFAFSSGVVVDIVGRKPVLMFSNIMFIVGAIVQCAAHGVWTMIVGRFIMGFGVGIGSLIAPLYISELAPSRFRGRLVVLNCLGITGGQLIAYAIGAGLNSVHNGWRIVVGLSMIPPAIQFVSFFFLPETPRFMIMKNKVDEAVKIFKRTHPNASEESIMRKVFALQVDEADIPGNPLKKWWQAVVELHTVPSNFRALFISCALQAIQQFTGFNSLMYFSATIFKAIGFNNSTAVSIVVAGTNFVFTTIAFFLIDKLGRRKMLLLSLPCVIAFLVLNAIAFHFVDIEFVGNDAIVHGDTNTWGVVIIVAMICFVACYAVGIGNVPWQQSEMFQQRVRGVGLSFACASNWAGSLVISSTFLTMLKNITPTGTFSLFAGFGLLSVILIFFTYPELSNLELEEVQDILTGGFQVKKSIQIVNARKLGSRINMEKSDDGQSLSSV
ncbi:myo-inositol transporter [Martiniozyma asiatica (nom. inval.)]|nr:myo-inositol transporter [Martiniozyma asiatica]